MMIMITATTVILIIV